MRFITVILCSILVNFISSLHAANIDLGPTRAEHLVVKDSATEAADRVEKSFLEVWNSVSESRDVSVYYRDWFIESVGYEFERMSSILNAGQPVNDVFIAEKYPDFVSAVIDAELTREEVLRRAEECRRFVSNLKDVVVDHLDGKTITVRLDSLPAELQETFAMMDSLSTAVAHEEPGKEFDVVCAKASLFSTMLTGQIYSEQMIPHGQRIDIFRMGSVFLDVIPDDEAMELFLARLRPDPDIEIMGTIVGFIGIDFLDPGLELKLGRNVPSPREQHIFSDLEPDSYVTLQYRKPDGNCECPIVTDAEP